MFRVMFLMWKWVYAGMVVDLILVGFLGYLFPSTPGLGQAVIMTFVSVGMVLIMRKFHYPEFSMLYLGYALGSIFLAIVWGFEIVTVGPDFPFYVGVILFLLYWVMLILHTTRRPNVVLTPANSLATLEPFTEQAAELVQLLEKAKIQAGVNERVIDVNYKGQVIGVAADSDLEERVSAYQLLKAGLIDSAADPYKPVDYLTWKM